MSTDTKAILFGKRSLEEIAAAIRRCPGVGPVEIRAGNTLIQGWIKVSEGGGDFRNISVFDGQEIGDDREIYSGERTLVQCGAYGDSVAIIEAATAAFGGFMQDRDGGDEVAWRLVEAGPEMELTPSEKLAIELAKVLSPHEAEIMRKLVEDPAKLAAFAEALEAFRDQASKPVVRM